MLEKVVVADDSATARMIIKRCLEIAGCSDADFLEAGDGEEALSIIRENQVDLVVTDLNMPNMDGKALLKHIKTSPKLTNVPTIIISSASNKAVEEDLLKQGAFAVLSKPVTPASIAKILSTLTDEDQWG